MTQSGYVYLLTNPSLRGIVKIGKTRQNPQVRVKALSAASGVPTPFILVYQAHFEDYNQAESFVHSKLDKFRVSSNREFFKVPIPEAVDVILEAKDQLGSTVLASSAQTKGEIDGRDGCDSIPSRTVLGPEQKLHELFDILMSYSMRAWSNYVKSKGLSMPQFSILMQLHYRGTFSISEISEVFGVTVPAASQLVERLVQAGYLERTEHPTDRRTKLLHLTHRGKNLIQQGIEERYRWVDNLAEKFDPEERMRVNEALELMMQAAQELEMEPVR